MTTCPMNMEVGTMTAPQAMGAVTSLVTSCCPAGNLGRKGGLTQLGRPPEGGAGRSGRTHRIWRSCVKAATAVPGCALFWGRVVLICSTLG